MRSLMEFLFIRIAMNKYFSLITFWMLTVLMCCFSITARSSQPVWIFTPLTPTSITISATGSAIVQYKITNQSPKPHTLAMIPIAGITQLTTGAGLCQTTFVLASQGSSCILSLQINGNLVDRVISGGPVVCQQGNMGQCYRPSLANNLNVRVTQNQVTIGGTITGLTANGLILQNNGSNNLSVSANATAFTFPTPVNPGSTYNVTIAQQPAGLSCSVSNGSGVATTNVTNVNVSCVLSGMLTPIAGSPFAAGQHPNNAVVSSNNQFLYVTNVNSNDVSAYSINAITGALTPIAGSPFAAGVGPDALAITSDNQFLYVTNANDNTISAYSINQLTGVLTPIAGSPFTTGNLPLSIAVSPNNNFVYTVNLNGNDVSAFSIGPSGALTPIAGSPFAAGPLPIWISLSPNGQYAYVANITGGITGFSVNTLTGALTPLAGSPFTATSPNFLMVSPNSEFVYVGSNANNWLAVYQINAATGALSEIVGSPFATPTPTNLAISSNNELLYVTNGVANVVSAFRITAGTGAITPITGSPYAAGQLPIGIAITPNGSFVYVANGNSNDMSGYTVS